MWFCDLPGWNGYPTCYIILRGGAFESVKRETVSNPLWLLLFKFHGKWITRSGFNSKGLSQEGAILYNGVSRCLLNSI